MSQIKCSRRHDCFENTAGRLAIMGPRGRQYMQGIHCQEGNGMGNVLFAFREPNSEDETHVEDAITIRSEICRGVPMGPRTPKGAVTCLALALAFNTHTRIRAAMPRVIITGTHSVNDHSREMSLKHRGHTRCLGGVRQRSVRRIHIGRPHRPRIGPLAPHRPAGEA